MWALSSLFRQPNSKPNFKNPEHQDVSNYFQRASFLKSYLNLKPVVHSCRCWGKQEWSTARAYRCVLLSAFKALSICSSIVFSLQEFLHRTGKAGDPVLQSPKGMREWNFRGKTLSSIFLHAISSNIPCVSSQLSQRFNFHLQAYYMYQIFSLHLLTWLKDTSLLTDSITFQPHLTYETA